MAVKIKWSDKAKNELQNTFDYLEENWTYIEIQKLAIKIEETLQTIKKFPFSYPKSKFNSVRKAVVLRFNTLYYKVNNDEIVILSFFSNRQKPIDKT